MGRVQWLLFTLGLVGAVVFTSSFTWAVPERAPVPAAERAPDSQSIEPAQPPPPGPPVSLDIAPNERKTLRALNGKISLDIPDGAASENLRITLTPRAAPASTGFRMLWRFDLDAMAPGRSNAKVTQFQKDLEIAVQYSEADARQLDLSSLRLFYKNEGEQKWVPLFTTVDDATRTARAKVNHFSQFGGGANPAYALPGQVFYHQVDLHSGTSGLSYPIQLPPPNGRDDVAVLQGIFDYYRLNPTLSNRFAMADAIQDLFVDAHKNDYRVQELWTENRAAAAIQRRSR